jgi:hypothetical protein
MRDDELRRRLRDAADDFHVSDRVPSSLLTRARIRIAFTVGIATLLVAGIGVGALFGVSALADRGSPPPVVGPGPTPSPTTDGRATCAEIEEALPAVPDTYQVKGTELSGDIDGDGSAERVTVNGDDDKPERCRYMIVVESADGQKVGDVLARLPWQGWFGVDPQPLALAQIDGRPGLEVVIDITPMAVYRPGAVYTMGGGELESMRLGGRRYGELFPIYDEFPAGSDCIEESGTIVVSDSNLADGGADDSHWDVTRTFYQANGTLFERVDREEYVVEVGPPSQLQFPELRGKAFISCPDRIP